jgi:hypothetical protein
MDFCGARCSGSVGTVVAVMLLSFCAECRTRAVQAETLKQRADSDVSAGTPREVRSPHFLLHTDLLPRETDERLERLETMLRLISAYWGRPMQGVIECYVVRDLDNFPTDTMSPAGVSGIRTHGGITLMRTVTDGRRYLAKSVVYADQRSEVLQHEAVHAYCHHTFGRAGPVWYSEGMAEMGHNWIEGDAAVRAESRVAEFLREHPPKSLQETLSPLQVTGDCWQNYAARWALCHFLSHDPNYASQFLTLGKGFLAGQETSFEQVYSAKDRELFFAYLLFLKHVSPGYRVDLCTWNWKQKFAALRPGQTLRTTVAAGRGWQATGLTVRPGMQYAYAATGNWRISGSDAVVDANGVRGGRGRLVGVLMNDYRLGDEFALGTEGTLHVSAAGNLYVRCRNAWNDLAEDSGQIAVQFTLQGQGKSRSTSKTTSHVSNEFHPNYGPSEE